MTSPATLAPAFRLNMGPSSTRLIGTTGQKYTGHVLVTDAGSVPLKIQMSAEQLTRCATGKAPSWLTVSGPRTFVLQPGHSRSVAFHVASPPHTTGSAAVVATASPAQAAHGAAHLAASIGSRVTLGQVKASCLTTKALAPVSHGPNLGLALLVALVALLAGVLVVVVVRRRRRGRHAI